MNQRDLDSLSKEDLQKSFETTSNHYFCNKMSGPLKLGHTSEGFDVWGYYMINNGSLEWHHINTISKSSIHNGDSYQRVKDEIKKALRNHKLDQIMK